MKGNVLHYLCRLHFRSSAQSNHIAFRFIKSSSKSVCHIRLVATNTRRLEINLNVKEIHARFCIEMCLNLNVLLVPSGGAEGRMYLFLGLNRWQLVVDCDRESSDVRFIVFFHGHACLKNGNETRKRREGEKKRESGSSSCSMQVSVSVFRKSHQSIYLVTIDAVRRWSRRSKLKMRADGQHLASPLTSTILVPCRTAKSIAQP